MIISLAGLWVTCASGGKRRRPLGYSRVLRGPLKPEYESSRATLEVQNGHHFGKRLTAVGTHMSDRNISEFHSCSQRVVSMSLIFAASDLVGSAWLLLTLPIAVTPITLRRTPTVQPREDHSFECYQNQHGSSLQVSVTRVGTTG